MMMQPETEDASVPQYSLGKTLAIWAAAAVPMAILGWIIAPALASGASTNRQAFTAGVTALTLGLIWQFALAVIIVYREEGNLRWTSIRRDQAANGPGAAPDRARVRESGEAPPPNPIPPARPPGGAKRSISPQISL